MGFGSSWDTPSEASLGMLLLKFMPKTHEIVEDIDLSDIRHEEISVERLTKQIKFDLSVIFMIKS